MLVDRVRCDRCDGRWDFAERIGTSSRYVEYCPGCGVGGWALTTSRVNLMAE